MFTPPAKLEQVVGAGKRREARFASWMSTEGKPMATPEAKETYIRTRSASRTSWTSRNLTGSRCCPSWVGFFAQYSGITPKEVMYDYDKYTQAWLKYNRDFKPDYLVFSGGVQPGKSLTCWTIRLSLARPRHT